MKNPVTEIPPGHYGITALQKQLRIGSATLQKHMQHPNFPLPAGRYISKGSSRRLYPYYSLDAAAQFINDPLTANETYEQNEYAGWGIPNQDGRQKRLCQQTRHFISRVFDSTRTTYGTQHA